MKPARILRHLLIPHWIALRPFSRRVLNKIGLAITASEAKHDGELRFVVEGGLHLAQLLQGQTPRGRAVQLFSELRVWDTEHNSGVLIYLQLVDRKIEIIADRGIHAKVEAGSWDAICRRMEAAFMQGRFESGALAAIGEITELLALHFPPLVGRANELPDRPVVL